MPLQDYRDTLLQCLKTLRTLSEQPEDYARFNWRAIYMTRGRFCYFFRATFNGVQIKAEGQQMDLESGSVSDIPWTSAWLYGATFGLNEAVAIYDGPLRSVIEVAHGFNEVGGEVYDPEFFYVKTDLVYASDDWRMDLRADPTLHKNTNLIFIGFEDGKIAPQVEESHVAGWMAKKKPMASVDWYAERYYYD